MNDRPLIYLVLGAGGSGRREVVADLIEGGLDEGARALVLLSDEERAADCDARLGAPGRWHWAGDRIETPPLAGATHVFLIADGRRNPVDQVEAFQTWLSASGGELARIICVVHCGLVAQHKELCVWIDACVHFSDIVLLNRREGLANKWMSDFQARFASQFLPCLFEVVKAGRVKNPALILEPQTRRMSHVFDEELNWEITGTDEEEAEGDEEVEAKPEEDPYFQRLQGARRAKVIPNVADYLPKE
jgi:hypothetical protein